MYKAWKEFTYFQAHKKPLYNTWNDVLINAPSIDSPEPTEPNKIFEELLLNGHIGKL